MLLKDLLKEDRKLKGLTQEKYAKEIGISRGTLSNLELGREPSSENLKKVSEYLNKPIDELIGDKKIKKLSELETTNFLIDSLIGKNQIKKDEHISEEVKNLIWSSLELEIKLKLELLND